MTDADIDALSGCIVRRVMLADEEDAAAEAANIASAFRRCRDAGRAERDALRELLREALHYCRCDDPTGDCRTACCCGAEGLHARIGAALDALAEKGA